MLSGLDDTEDGPANWKQQDEEMQTLDAGKDVSVSGRLSGPTFVYSIMAIRPWWLNRDHVIAPPFCLNNCLTCRRPSPDNGGGVLFGWCPARVEDGL